MEWEWERNLLMHFLRAGILGHIILAFSICAAHSFAWDAGKKGKGNLFLYIVEISSVKIERRF
jgi:hypothetical protein